MLKTKVKQTYIWAFSPEIFFQHNRQTNRQNHQIFMDFRDRQRLIFIYFLNHSQKTTTLISKYVFWPESITFKPFFSLCLHIVVIAIITTRPGPQRLVSSNDQRLVLRCIWVMTSHMTFQRPFVVSGIATQGAPEIMNESWVNSGSPPKHNAFFSSFLFYSSVASLSVGLTVTYINSTQSLQLLLWWNVKLLVYYTVSLTKENK